MRANQKSPPKPGSALRVRHIMRGLESGSEVAAVLLPAARANGSREKDQRLDQANVEDEDYVAVRLPAARQAGPLRGHFRLRQAFGVTGRTATTTEINPVNGYVPRLRSILKRRSS